MTRKPLDLKKEIGEIVTAEERQFAHDRSATAGSSEVFGCWRRLYFKKREPDKADAPDETDDIEWGATERGNVIENKFAVPKIQQILGPAAKHMGEEQVTLFDKEAPLSCTPDGIMLEQPRDFLANYGIADMGSDLNDIAVEIKTFDPRSGDLTTEPRARHMGQNIIQQGMYQRVTNYRPLHGLIIYFNPANLKDIRPFAVKYDDAVYKRGQERALAVFDLTKTAKDFRSEGKRTGECAHCEFFTRCQEVEAEICPDQVVKTADIPPETLAELGNKCKAVAESRAELKKLTAKVKALVEDLRFALIDLGTTRAGDTKKLGWLTSIRLQNGRKSFNKAMAEADGIDIDKYMVEGPAFYVVNAKVQGIEEVKE